MKQGVVIKTADRYTSEILCGYFKTLLNPMQAIPFNEDFRVIAVEESIQEQNKDWFSEVSVIVTTHKHSKLLHKFLNSDAQWPIETFYKQKINILSVELIGGAEKL